jgi:hypothetical protein
MRRPQQRAFAATVLLTLGFAGSGVPAADAKESFHDEAGRVIYTIDDDGIVSMFENSPTDLTLSVTRGTREKMQPRITSVSPESIPAGTTSVLKLKGENLVGASVKMSLPGIEVKSYVGKPRSVDIPLFVPGNAPAGEITVEVTTPIGSTKTTFKVTELQIGGSAPAKRDDAGKTVVSTAAPANCPEGMVGVAAERGGFCIEIEQTFTSDSRKVEQFCAIAGKRLCEAAEWRTACEQASSGKLSLKNMVGDWEWTGTQVIKEKPGQDTDYGATGELNAVLLGRSDCAAPRYFPVWKTEAVAGRCCK